jgi:hypothetical protein
MATAPIINPRTKVPKVRRYQLPVSRFDRAATMVLSLLLMLGAAVASLAVIFFANKFSSAIEPIAFVPVEASSPDANQGIAEEPQPPGVDDAPELMEPQLQDTLNALSTLSLDEAILADEAIDAAVEAGKGEGLGDSRQLGPGGDGVIERVPRWERWKIRFEPRSSADFTRWLDEFGIRIGVLGRDNKVHAAWSFTSEPQVFASDPRDYVTWGQTVPADGPMPRLTAELARQAGILSEGQIILLFYPKQVEDLLWTLEQAANPSGDPNKIRETVFTVIPQSDGYKFEVIDQKFF